jgi:Ser/Thr protein kinase RdoA (MazF antagonist)
MTTFPVLASIPSTKHVALYVKEKYNLGFDTYCKIMKTGINHTYLISNSKAKYVFRIYSYNWRTEIEIKEELRLINILKEKKISVSFPLSDLKGNYIQKIDAPEGLRYAVLFSFAEGDKIRELSNDHSYSIGLLMGNIHQQLINKTVDRVQYDINTLLKPSYLLAKEHFPESMEEMTFVKNAIEYLDSVFEQTDANQLRKGIVHLDMWYDNMNIAENSKITLFDFDFCGNGLLIFDMAYTIMQLYHTEPDKDKFNLKRDKFIAGYQTTMTITDKELELIPLAGLAVWIFYLGIQAKRYDDWSNLFFSKNYLKHFIGMVKSWLDYNKVEIKVVNRVDG